MRITLNKTKAIIDMIVIILLEFIGFNILGSNQSMDIELKLRILSFITVLIFIFELYIWIKMTKEVFSPYTVFFMVLFLFCCGQTIGWLFGLDMGNKDLWNRMDHGLNKMLLYKGLVYSCFGISFFHFGSIIGTKCDKKNGACAKWSSEKVINSYSKLSKFLLIVCIPAFIANSVVSLLTVIQGGYAEIYIYQQSSSYLMRFLDILANYYQPCLLLLLITYRNKKKKRRIIVSAMMFDVILNLFIGGRSGAVMTLLAIALSYHYFVKPFSLKNVYMGIISGYFGIVILNAIAEIRDVADKSMANFLPALVDSSTNVIGKFIGELGWSLTSVCWTMNIVPKDYSYRYGMSYLISLISWVPSFVFGGIHPVIIWGELSIWLQGALKMTYGPGYTMIAESYLNFSTFGVIALLIEGIIVSIAIAKIRRIDSNNNLLDSTFQIMVIMVLMKSIVRSSVSIVFRQMFFVVLPLYILIQIMLKRGDNK